MNTIFETGPHGQRCYAVGRWQKRASRSWVLQSSIAVMSRCARQVPSSLQPFVSSLLVEQLAKIGQIKLGLELANEALASTRNDRYWCDAELERLPGELLLSKDDVPQAEAAYRRATKIAQKQQAKMFELRSTINLAQLWLKQGRSAQSRELLGRSYGWFTEGLEFPDLQTAQALLEVS
jgi:predicted ATPase